MLKRREEKEQLKEETEFLERLQKEAQQEEEQRNKEKMDELQRMHVVLADIERAKKYKAD